MSDLIRVGDIPLLGKIQKRTKPLSPSKLRVIEASADSLDPKDLLYMHTVFCQIALPYSDPGDTVREWERDNGKVGLKVIAGDARHPQTGAWVKVGLPFGPKARLILGDINTAAIITRDPLIDLDESLNRYVKRMRLDDNGRNVRSVKDIFTRLCACSMRIGVSQGERSTTFQSYIMSGFEIWLPKDARQRVLWPSTAQLSADYFRSLVEHAVPLDQVAYFSLSHSALAMDIYAWLAQRLWRIKTESVLVTWPQVHMQFAGQYKRLRKFREKFLVALKQALDVYRDARVGADSHGPTLRPSPSPVRKKQVLVP